MNDRPAMALGMVLIALYGFAVGVLVMGVLWWVS